METLKNTKVGKIVAQNFRTAKIFTNYGIDFCCRGGISLEQACQNHQVDVEKIATDLIKAVQIPDDFQYNQMNASQLVEHIVSVHHKYVTENIPVLMAYLAKVSNVHGERHPELKEINTIFIEIANELREHLKKEEMILFPYIVQLDKEKSATGAFFGHIQNPIAMMEHEHETVGDLFAKIAQLTNHYVVPADACQTYRVSFSMLDAFEKDLHLHIHLENNLLFPIAKQLYEYSLN